jgi:hypothetical protein
MRLAWFRPANADSGRVDAAPDDDTALLIHALRARHTIDVIESTRAHDFVWQHARQPWDLCVYELGGSPAHRFIAAYAAHYPGITLLRGLVRDDQALVSSRLVVVPHEPVAQAVADDYPEARVRTLVPGVAPLYPERQPADSEPVVEALRWPPDGAALTRALAGFAAARAVIVFDGLETADWPTLNPQDWRLRNVWQRRDRADMPICVSIDPRDEAHSLRLARRVLAEDEALRRQLGTAAQAWWRAHATVDIAAAGFEALLDEAMQLTEPQAAARADDGSARARRIFDELGLEFRISG